MQSAEGKNLSREPIDTSKPMDISEEEELERISALLQRDNLVRGLGIVEHVYRCVDCDFNSQQPIFSDFKLRTYKFLIFLGCFTVPLGQWEYS